MKRLRTHSRGWTSQANQHRRQMILECKVQLHAYLIGQPEESTFDARLVTQYSPSDVVDSLSRFHTHFNRAHWQDTTT